jgi:tetratricopeptide (TPR) repeat protein
VDGDGDLDLVLLSLQGLRLVENTCPPRSWARVRLRAEKTQWHAANAVVKVAASGVTRQDYVRLTDGFMTQVPADLHFGLGDATKIDRLEVIWPSGATQAFEGLPVSRLISIREGGAPVTSELPRWSDADRPKAPPAFSFDLQADRLGGGRGPLAENGLPVVINFWSPSCAPCRKELPGLAAVAAQRGAEARFAGVSLETADLKAVSEAVAAFRVPYPQFVANDALVKSFFGDEKNLPIPSTFVFDGGGRLRRAFQRDILPGELSALLDSLRDEGVAVGDLERRGSRLVEQGRFEDGLRYLEQAVAALPKKAVIRYHIGIAHFSLGRDDRALAAFQAAVDLDPEFARAQINLAEVLRKVGRFDDAIAHYQAAIRIRGEDYNALFGLADAAASAGKYPAALDAFERAVKADPKPVAVLKAKAKFHGMLRQPEEAKKCLQRVLELEPGDAEAKKALAELR